MIAGTAAMGLLPLFGAYDALKMVSLGSIVYGGYAFLLPSRMVHRLQPRVAARSPGERCVVDLFRAWGIFAAALGACGLRLSGAGTADAAAAGNGVFFVVGLVSIFWDCHVMTSEHWGARGFVAMNLAVNAAVCLATGTALLQKNVDLP